MAYYIYQEAEKLSPKETRMSTVTVFSNDHRKIGNCSFSRLNPTQKDLEYMASEVLRDHQIKEAWQKIEMPNVELFHKRMEEQ